MPAALAPELAERTFSLVACAARQPDVRAAVEANHDDNRWWPLSVADWRVRMTAAGWSTRVSYSMISTYAGVVARADALGWTALTALDDMALAALVRPLGLVTSRVSYLRSLAGFIAGSDTVGADLATMQPEHLIRMFAASVCGAGYKVAQCAALYAHGYHCGIIPVDSGMVAKLAPFLGITLHPGPAAHEQFRHLLQAGTSVMAGQYKDLAAGLGYRVSIPEDADPTWFVHLVLIYFKRLYLNRPGSKLCPSRPACGQFLDCGCVTSSEPEAAVSLLAVAGNISRDLAIYPDGTRAEMLGGAALHVALAATRAGLPTAPVTVIGADLGWITGDPRLAGLDLGHVTIVPGESCAFTLTYDNAGQLIAAESAFGVTAGLTEHVLGSLGAFRCCHVCCRRPLDTAPVLHRLTAMAIPFTLDFHLPSADVHMPAASPFLPSARIVFVNAAEFAILSQVADPISLQTVVISDGPRPAVVLRHGRRVASALPPAANVTEVTGAGDTLTGTFLAAAAQGLDHQAALAEAVDAASRAVASPGLAIPGGGH